MADERKPLTDIRLFRTENGGWVIRTEADDFGRTSASGTYAYSSDRDLMDALPGLIGYSEYAKDVVNAVTRELTGNEKDDGGFWRGFREGYLSTRRDGYENGD